MKISKTTRKEITVAAPPAKAYSLRAILLSGLAAGRSLIRHPLLAADQLALIDSLRKLGCHVQQAEDCLEITGCNGRFSPLGDVLDLNESGVGMNFLISAASFTGKPVMLTGREGLLKRPVGELVNGLRQLGCRIDYLAAEGFPPVKNHGTGIGGGTIRMSGAKSSQYFSSVAIAAPLADGEVVIECSDEMTEKPYFDITLEMMEMFGVTAHRDGYSRIRLANQSRYQARDLTVEGDYSSASYYFTAAAVCGNTVHVTGLNLASLQGDKRLLDLFEQMGCRVERTAERISVSGGRLQAITTGMADLPDMVPSLAMAAAFASGTTVITHIGHLRYKECNRLAAITAGLQQMGVESHYDETSLYITGKPRPAGARIDACNDHRIAMSFAVAGLACGEMDIPDEKCVAKSFPDFWQRLQAFY